MPRVGPRLVVERGIYRDASGYEVVARARRLRHSKRFPIDTHLSTLRAWRDTTAGDLHAEAQPTTDPSTIAGAIAKYIALTKLPLKHAYRPALNTWIAEFGTTERRKLTAAICVQAIERWRNAGLSGQTLYYRRLVIAKVWQTLDGPQVKTPVDRIKITRAKMRRPMWVPDSVIQEVAAELLKHERDGLLRDAKTRARFLVLASTGQRPAQLKRALPADVDLKRKVWWVRKAKGGHPIPVFLNTDMLYAWKLFIRAKAWGHYTGRNFTRVLRHCGWPAGVRPYNVRHATALTLRARGADLGDIQDHLGHAALSTTRIYATAIESRMRSISGLLEGRFGWGRVAPKRGTARKR